MGIPKSPQTLRAFLKKVHPHLFLRQKLQVSKSPRRARLATLPRSKSRAKRVPLLPRGLRTASLPKHFMSLHLNKPKLDNLAGEIWKSAVRLRGKFKAYEYQSVILPIIVIRRLECVLIKWREEKAAEIRKARPKITDDELAKLVKNLELNPQQCPFSNKTDWTLHKVMEEDQTLLEDNYRAYIKGFSENVQEIIEHFNYRATITEMVKRNRLAPILNQYKNEALGPQHLSNLEMGYVYEELLRRFSEEAGEEAGDHFTPREVIRLMVELLDIPIPDKHLPIYDPTCGTGGMLQDAVQPALQDRANTRRGAESLSCRSRCQSAQERGLC